MDVMCSRALYVCACVVPITAECGYVVSLCFLFFIYCLFYFFCNVFIFYNFFLHFLCQDFFVVLRVCCARTLSARALYVCAHAVRITTECGYVVSLCFYYLFIVCFIFLYFFLLFVLHFFCQDFLWYCVCVVRGHYVLARARARGVLVVCLWCARARGVLVVCLYCGSVCVCERERVHV